MMRPESGGLEEATAYALVHIDFALGRYAVAGGILNEMSEAALKKGNVTLAATAPVKAANIRCFSAPRRRSPGPHQRAVIAFVDALLDKTGLDYET